VETPRAIAVLAGVREKETESRSLEMANRKLQEMVKQLKVELLWHERYVSRLDQAVAAQRKGVFELQQESPELENAVAVTTSLKAKLEAESKHLAVERDALSDKITSLKAHSLSLDHDVTTFTELLQKEQGLIDGKRAWIEQNRQEVASYEAEIDRAKQKLRTLEEESTAVELDITKGREELQQCQQEWDDVKDSIHAQRTTLAAQLSERASILADLEMHRERIKLSHAEYER
jgi:chromosome segregation ATPase